MAEKEKKTKYESVEKVKELLDEQNLGRLQKSLSATEGKLSEILKKLTALETEKAEKEAELARIEAERVAKEEAEKAREAAEARVDEYALAMEDGMGVQLQMTSAKTKKGK